jgi:hypothetical protein
MNPQRSGGAGAHVPFMHTPSHVAPQAPQLRASVARSAHTLPVAQSVFPAGHAHVPSLQTPFAAHAVAHDPQCARSLRRFTQADRDPAGQTSGRSAGHAHAPSTHASPSSGHCVPHAPQWFGSDDVFAHAGDPGHATTPGVASHTQPPATHDPAPHPKPHAPQWASFDARSTHHHPHTSWPAGHAHRPLRHAAPIGQLAPQDPQLLGSDPRSTQNDDAHALAGQNARSRPHGVGGAGAHPVDVIARATIAITAFESLRGATLMMDPRDRRRRRCRDPPLVRNVRRRDPGYAPQ